MAVTGPAQMISNIQLLRGLAAFAVAFYHAGYVIPGTVYSDFLAVPIFFVISGFIMTHITRVSSDYFLLHRLIRIVPLYWLATLAYAALVAVIYPVMGKHSDNVVTISTLLRDLFFIPRLDDDGVLIFPVLSVGWTLNLEMYFYLIFAGALQISRRAAPVIVAVVVLIVWFSGRISTSAVADPDFSRTSLRLSISRSGLPCTTPRNCRYNRPRSARSQLLRASLALVGFATTARKPIMALIAPPLIVVSAVLLETWRRSYAALPLRPWPLVHRLMHLYLCHAFVIGLFREATKSWWPARA